MERFFDNLNGLRFIEIGANDGVYQDCLRQYIKHNNWRGILVEPQKHIFEKLVQGYQGKKCFKNLKFENVAVTDYEGSVDFHVDRNRPNLSAIDANDTKLKMHIENGTVDVVSVLCTTIMSLLEKYKMMHVDVVYIDVEGHEERIIKSMDFTRIAPAVIWYEHINQKQPQECARYLERYGYSVMIENKFDAIAYKGKI